MREIKVQALIQRKGDRIIVQCRVDLRTGIPQGVVVQSGKDFLNVAYPYCTARGRAKGIRTIPRKVNGVPEVYPLVVCEEITESAVAISNLVNERMST
jgi:hypothetical protein